ncbi:CRTAC1 family protein [candidate division KSB1 bacterium]|nr:CRTAC1 family protein [candidate division KSB1 bacterium]TDI93819.1 MAG: CRTAC1 family protein [Caldithrix sp.]
MRPDSKWFITITSFRIMGILMIISGLLLNRWAIGRIVAQDGNIESTTLQTVIILGQIILLIAGIWLLLRKGSVNWSGLFRLGLTLACVAAVTLGAYGTGTYAYQLGINRGWIQLPIKNIPEICELLSGDDVDFFGLAVIDRLSGKLAQMTSEQGEGKETILLRSKLADHLLRHGRVEKAIDHLETAYQLAISKDLPSDALNKLRRELGVAYLRGGEINHCIEMHNPERCLFPIRGEGVWSNSEGASKAIGYFEEYLRAQPGDAGVRWLFNLAHMAIGSYPDGVKSELLLPEWVIESTREAPRFRDIAPDLGLDAFNLSGGSIMDDFDNDGFLDIITSTWEPCSPMLYYHNNGDGSFSDWSAKAKLTEQYGGLNLVHADYNNDGLLDILVLRGAWMGRKYGRQRNSLLRQNTDGTFTDVTKESGLGSTAFPCISAGWADYNGDGNIDLYIANERFPGQLFRNNGDGTFEDVARSAGVDNQLNGKGVTWGDYDNDGDPDLYISNLGGLNRLYRNNGDGTFTDVARETGVEVGEEKKLTFATWFWDVDNDGWLDLFVAGYDGWFGPSKLQFVAADYFGMPASAEHLRLFRNDGTGHFDDVTKEMGLYHIRLPMGANYGDVDNDGFPDIYLGTGAPPYDTLIPNVMYRNEMGKRFVDITASAGVGHLQKGHAIAFGDLDNDGDQDIFAQMGGAYPGDGFHNALFENPGNSNHWITIRLVGVQSNRFGIGAKIKLIVDSQEGERSIFNTVGSGGSFGASSLQQEIGVGDANLIKELEVYWPSSNTRQRFQDVGVDQIIEITESAETYRVLDNKRIQFSKATSLAKK